MTPEIKKLYKDFFESAGGDFFMKQLTALMDDCHSNAENKPDYSRDYTQRAKGVREVEAHIQSATAEAE